MTAALIITVGIPGSGKSRLAQQRLDAGDVDLIVSSDAIREEFGDVTDMSNNPDVFFQLYKRTAVALDAGQQVIVDATNLRPGYRENLWAIANGANADRLAWLFADSLDFNLCQARNVNRTRVVPEPIMRKMFADFATHCTVADLTLEGWDVEIIASIPLV